MGREIRKVPANWEHPKKEHYPDRYQPIYDRTFAEAAKEWKEEFAKWEAGERPDYCGEENKNLEYWEWEGKPPDPEYYRPYKDEEATWLQVYETVSEGTPVTPPFATADELIEYLSTHGDFWCQKRGETPPSKAAAAKFVNMGWAPSMIVSNGTIKSGIDALEEVCNG